MRLTREQIDSIAYHASNIQRLEAAKDHIKDEKVRVFLGPDKPKQHDPLGQGHAIDIDVSASTIRDRVNWLLARHYAALRELGVEVIPG